MTPPLLGQSVVSPQGLFVEVSTLESDPSFGGSRDWFDSIIRDFRQASSPNRMETLVLSDYARKDDATGSIVLIKDSHERYMLDLIKDYLSQFDYLFVGSWLPKTIIPGFDITKPFHRNAHINAARDAASLFIQYLRDANINVPIHWYIAPEANLSSFGILGGGPYVGGFKDYIIQFTGVMTNLSQINGMNEPEFLWSPFFEGHLIGSVQALRDLLVSVPKLRWMHVQDGLGVNTVIHPNSPPTIRRTSENVISYYSNFLIPASGTLSNLRVNMELFVYDEQDPPGMPPGFPNEQANRQSKYKQSNIPVGVSFEIRYWYGSMYYKAVPNVIRLDANGAADLLSRMDLVPIFDGPTINAKVIDQYPPNVEYTDVLHWVPNGTVVNLKTAGAVVLEDFHEWTFLEAKTWLENHGLLWEREPHFSTNWVESSHPGANSEVAVGDTVKLHLHIDDGHPPP